MSSNDALFASMVGSKVANSLPRFGLVQNELSKLVLPAIPFLPTKNQKIDIAEGRFDVIEGKTKIWQSDKSDVSRHFFPLTFRREIPGEPNYTFPYEPLITISGGNTIAMHKPAKAENFIGTIKQHWTQDDYEITITGVFIGDKEIGSIEDCFPKADFQKLKDYCTHPQGILVFCEPLQQLGINKLIVTKFSFPFTKGENVQAYEIQALSDYSSDFLLEIE